MTDNLPMVQRQTTHFYALDAQRGVAAFLVLLGHATSVMLGAEHTWVARKGLAVVFFFMLSGFVVASAYQSKLRLDGFSVNDFMMRRIIRLYPLILLGTAFATVWFAAFDNEFLNSKRWIIAFGTSLFCLPSLHTSFSFGRFPINPPEWSLFFEILCYLAFAALAAKASTHNIALITGLCAIAFGISDWKYFNDLPFSLLGFEAAASFLSGILIWRAYEKGILPPWQIPPWALSLAVAAVCLCPLSLGPAVDIAALLVVFPAVIILGAAEGRGSASPAEKLLGELSFPVYILHWPFLLAANRFIQPSFGSALAVLAAIITSILFAWLTLTFYDKPVRAWLGKRMLLITTPTKPMQTPSRT